MSVWKIWCGRNEHGNWPIDGDSERARREEVRDANRFQLSCSVGELWVGKVWRKAVTVWAIRVRVKINFSKLFSHFM